jgi:hypothetical protein
MSFCAFALSLALVVYLSGLNGRIQYSLPGHPSIQCVCGLRELCQKTPTKYHLAGMLAPDFYEARSSGRLQTSKDRKASPLLLPEPFSQRLTIVDTSPVWPFSTRNLFQSRFNLTHALAIRNLVLHLRDADCVKDDRGRGTVGLCTPYAAQAKLLREMLRSHTLEKVVRASTAHGFQGDERPVLVLDLVDSIGERNAGLSFEPIKSKTSERSCRTLRSVGRKRRSSRLIVSRRWAICSGAKLPKGCA